MNAIPPSLDALIEAAKAHNRARKAVLDWKDEQSKLGNPIRLGDAPAWREYEDAKDALFKAADKVGT